MTLGRFSVTLLIGAPGAGKGTQARYVREALSIPHIATGDLLREHRRRGTALGRTARAYMDRGDLVPDELVVQMVVERLEQPDAANGALLDGFPRTQPQADALDKQLGCRGGGVLAALFLDVPPSILVRRLSGRRMCDGCQSTFHVDLHDLPSDGSCPECGDHLVQRRDDQRSAVARRISVYLEQTTPVLEHYRARGLVHRVDGDREVDEIKSELLGVLYRRVPALAAS
ncbi:MAG: adenylate kinase [Chloroflexota bacterium]